MAHDLLTASREFASHYTEADEKRFAAYIEQQLARIDLPGKDEDFLRSKLLLMYANPLTNNLKV